MKIELKNLYDKKGKIVNEMKDSLRDVQSRGGVPTTEEKAKFDAWDNELSQIQEAIDFQVRMEKLDLVEAAKVATAVESGENKEKKFNEAASRTERRNALEKSNVKGYSSLSDAERVIVDTELRDVAIFEKMLRGKELNAEEAKILAGYREKRVGVQSTTLSAGGYTIPEGFAGRIVEYMKYISDLLNWASIMRTDTGNTIPFPINDDTSNTGELIGENADISTATADLLFSVYNLKAYKFSSKMIKVSSELLQDEGVNLVDYIAKKLAERVARITNTYYTVGTGSNQPQGFLAAAERGGVTASTSTFTFAEMVSFQDSLDPAYRNGRVAWSMHSNLLSEIKQLSIAATTEGAIWVPSFRVGEPDTILGKPYFLNQAMSSTSATGDKILAYGDWSKFNIRVVNDFALRQLNERYAEFDQVAWFGLMRTDSFLEDTTALKYLDIS